LRNQFSLEKEEAFYKSLIRIKQLEKIIMNKTKNKNTTDITKEDVENIGNKTENLRSDGGADEVLKHRERPVDFSGSELDVPGRSLPKDGDSSKLKDEENQLYSQGGDGNDNLEESKS
jgi:hypothetical protein